MNHNLKPIRERAKKKGMSLQTQYRLDRLAREFPEMCRLVAEGSLSVNAATKAAGIESPKSPLKIVQHAWKRASADERHAIRVILI